MIANYKRINHLYSINDYVDNVEEKFVFGK
jgi:hypothetical protein